MTTKDFERVALGAGLGLAAFFSVWWLFRRSRKVLELAPVQVKWEGQ